jgi:RNA polymerase sigma factor (sigma-70 family)
MSDNSMDSWPVDRLLREANSGNAEAFQLFCSRSLPGLVRYAAARCRDLGVPPDLADDFVHDAFLKAVRFLAKTETEEDGKALALSPAWLRTIIYNNIRDWRKKNRRNRNECDSDHDLNQLAAPNGGVQLTDEHEELLEFFEWLTNRERDVLELVYVKGMTFLAVAAHLEISLDAAYKAHERGLNRLRDCVEQHSKVDPISSRH